MIGGARTTGGRWLDYKANWVFPLLLFSVESGLCALVEEDSGWTGRSWRDSSWKAGFIPVELLGLLWLLISGLICESGLRPLAEEDGGWDWGAASSWSETWQRQLILFDLACCLNCLTRMILHVSGASGFRLWV